MKTKRFFQIAVVVAWLAMVILIAQPAPSSTAMNNGAQALFLPLVLKNSSPSSATATNTVPAGNTPTVTPTATSTATPTATSTATPTATATATQAVGFINGNFEQGTVGWTLYSKNGYLGLIGTADSLGSSEITPRVYPRSGIYMARLGGFNYEINEIYQTVTLPNVTPLYLIFYYQIRGAPGSDCGNYGGVAQIWIGGTKVYDHCIYQYLDTADWTKGVIDLSAIPGQTVQIVFHVESAYAAWNYLYLDDIALAQTY